MNYWKTAEQMNGRLAMMGLLAAVVNYGLLDGLFQAFSKMKIKSQFTLTKVQLMTPEAERFNGWAAMLGFVAAVGAYATTGNIIPGIF